MIYNLWKSGALDLNIKLGIIREAIPKYCLIYEEYLKQRATGLNYIQAVEKTSEIMNTSSDTVKRAIAEVM
jgi:hypothetical protein